MDRPLSTAGTPSTPSTPSPDVEILVAEFGDVLPEGIIRTCAETASPGAPRVIDLDAARTDLMALSSAVGRRDAGGEQPHLEPA